MRRGAALGQSAPGRGNLPRRSRRTEVTLDCWSDVLDDEDAPLSTGGRALEIVGSASTPLRREWLLFVPRCGERVSVGHFRWNARDARPHR